METLIFEQAEAASERYYTTGYPDSNPINANQEYQYFGWGDNECWCGNTEPFSPRPMEDCENNRNFSSKIYSNTNSSKFYDELFLPVHLIYRINRKINGSIVQSDQNMMAPQMKNSH